MSEGLLVVTNDGELANRLTKASSGVEKTYLVKVAGQPTEDQLNILRGGVAIERGKPGSPQVRTSPARIRQVRQGDNPWYEVVLIEGRNRELRKMFEEIGHFVEKIRRTGYGPLVLDQEPGSLRELEPGELDLLRKAAEGKLRTPKAKDLRRRNLLDAGLLPTVLPKPSGRPRQAIPPASAPLDEGTTRPSEFRPKRTFSPASSPARPATGANRPSGSYAKPFRPARPAPGEFRPGPGRPPASNFTRGPARSDDRPRRTGPASGTNRPSGTGRPSSSGPSRFGSAPRPAWKKDERPTRPPARFTPGPAGEGSPATARPTYDRPRAGSPRQSAAGTGRTGAGRPFAAKPTWKKPERSDRPERPGFKRPSPPRRESRDLDADLGPVRPPNLHIEEITGGPSSAPRPSFSRPSAPRPFTDRPRPSFDRPDSSPRSGPPKPFRREGGLARPFTTSSGKPRAGGARPSSKPGSSRPYTPRAEGASGSRPARPYSGSAPRTEGKPAWKPRPSFGSGGKPTGGSRAGSKPGGHKPGGFSKPGYKPKPGGSGPRHTGGKPGGRKRS
jgi:23S rRNA pseudouridine2605 synthase